MASDKVRKTVLTWWAAGLLLGIVQLVAIFMEGPLGVSTQFVIADAKIINELNPEYAQNHALISQEKYQKFGYGFWLDIGIIGGAFVAALATRRIKFQATTVWWRTSRGTKLLPRFITGFIGGILILIGARLAHGCTSGAFASGWAQLSLSAAPFTVTLFGFGMLTAWIMYPKTPEIEK